MAQTSRFFDLASYTEAEFAEVLSRIARPDGVLTDATGLMAVTSGGGMVINIDNGEALFKGFWYRNSAVVGVTMGNNSSGSTRVDTIVLTLDRVANSVLIGTHVGTPGAGAPTLTQVYGGTWEFPLADVSVPNGAVSLNAGNITDRRVMSRWESSTLDLTVAYDADVAAEAATRLANDNTEAATRSAQDTLHTQRVVKAFGRIVPGSGSVATLTYGFNIAAVQRLGTGYLEATFTTPMASTNYVTLIATDQSGATGFVTSGDRQTGLVRIQTGSDRTIEFAIFGGN